MTSLENFISSLGFMHITFHQVIMIALALVLAYLAIVKKYEPLITTSPGLWYVNCQYSFGRPVSL